MQLLPRKSIINKEDKARTDLTIKKLEQYFRLCYRSAANDGYLQKADEDTWIKDNFKKILKDIK